MSFVKGLTLAPALAASLAGMILPAEGAAQSGQPAASRAQGPKPSPATERGPSAVEILNKSLNPGDSSDPDVPLPHPDLANVGPSAPARNGTQVYGRQEEGGGVLGLRMPIPVDRGGAAAAPRTGGGTVGSGGTLQGR